MNNSYRTDFQIFVFPEFCFQFEFLFNFDFQMHKTYLKSFLFELLFIGGKPFISLMAKFEAYNVLASKLEHFKNEMHFC